MTKLISFLLVIIFICLTTAGQVSAITGPYQGMDYVQKSRADESADINKAKEKETLAWKAGARDGEISYSKALRAGEEGKIKKIILLNGAYEAEAVFPDQSSANFAYLPGNTAFIDNLAKQGVEVEIGDSSGSGGYLSGLIRAFLFLSIIALVIFFFYKIMSKRGQKGREMKIKESKGEENSVPGFSAVAGAEEAIEEISEFSEYLKNPSPFMRVGARMPKGVLLHGPPGTGKTLLAKALAAEAGVEFFAASGTDFVEKYVGVGASRVRKLFRKAREAENGAVIFLDEIDAIGRKRSGEGENSNDEREGTLNEILVQLDGFRETEKLLVIGATNRVDILDDALLRPGRLSRQIHVSSPNEGARLEILELYAKGKPLAENVSLERLAGITAGSSGADLCEMINEAAIMAARRGEGEITEADLWEGHLRVLAGPEKQSSPANEDERKIIAYHEAGHVLLAELCPGHEKAERATIKPRGQAAGLAVYGQKDRALHSEEYLREQLLCILGGRAAEEVAFGNASSGAANDLQRANVLARRAIEEWGVSERVGKSAKHGQRHSENKLSIIDEEVREMVEEAYETACHLVRANSVALRSLAEMLLEKEDITRFEILEAIGGEQGEEIPKRKKVVRPPVKERVPVQRTTTRKGRRRGIGERIKQRIIEKLEGRKKKISSPQA